MDTQERVTSLVLNSGGSPEIVAGILAIFAEERAALAERLQLADDLMRLARERAEKAEADFASEREACEAAVRQWNKAEAREAALVAAMRRARADFAGPVAKLCEMTGTHPFTQAIADIDAALARHPDPEVQP